MKIIKFIANSKRSKELDPQPKPATALLPKWFKETPKYDSVFGGTTSVLDFVKNRNGDAAYHMTFKMCQPFLDSMTSGYTLLLPATVIVTQMLQPDGTTKPRLDWNVGYDIADVQNNLVASRFPRPVGYSEDLFRWINNWKIKTPAGYSSLIIHPSYRNDLPFHTLTGLVDTDKHINPVILPFFIKEGYEGEIPVGTPIAQVIPFRRENWQSEFSVEDNSLGIDKVKQTFQKAYRNLWWTKKSYR
jgi:hypothetical protein